MKSQRLAFSATLLIALFALSSCANHASTRNESGEAPILLRSVDNSCEQILANATWQNTDLSTVTRQCPPAGWESFFAQPNVQVELRSISDSIKNQVAGGSDVNPTISATFRALYLVSPANVRAVILGQDPAPEPGQATGLSFSLKPGVSPTLVPSVERVMLEAGNEGYCMNMLDGDLSTWAAQGVLMLNTALTIPCPTNGGQCQIAGHELLWQKFSQSVIDYLETQPQAFTYILWGGAAGQYVATIHTLQHRVLRGGHPSPRASGAAFFCKSYFSCTNDWLSGNGLPQVNWSTAAACQPQQACVWSASRNPTCQQSCAMATCFP